MTAGQSGLTSTPRFPNAVHTKPTRLDVRHPDVIRPAVSSYDYRVACTCSPNDRPARRRRGAGSLASHWVNLTDQGTAHIESREAESQR
jgi:hypothetical protein